MDLPRVHAANFIPFWTWNIYEQTHINNKSLLLYLFMPHMDHTLINWSQVAMRAIAAAMIFSIACVAFRVCFNSDGLTAHFSQYSKQKTFPLPPMLW